MLFLISLGVLYWAYKNKAILEEKIKNQCGEEVDFKLYSKESLIRLGVASIFVCFGFVTMGSSLVLSCFLMGIVFLILLYEIFLAYKKTNFKYGTIVSLVYIILFFTFISFEITAFSFFIFVIAWLLGLFYL